MKTQQFLTELSERAKGIKDVNPFWRKIQTVGIILFAVGSIVVTLPWSISNAGSYFIAIGTTITTIAQLTKK